MTEELHKAIMKRSNKNKTNSSSQKLFAEAVEELTILCLINNMLDGDGKTFKCT